MKELSNSVSTYYKSRAGTAYPVVERLVSLGLLMYSDNSGLKGERLVTISPDGIAALDEWLKPPVPMEEVAHTVDFLRLRAFYLGATTAEAREAFFQDAIEGLNLHIANLDAAILEYQKMGDLFSELALTGTIFEARARIEWLESIRERALAAPQARPPKQLQSLQ